MENICLNSYKCSGFHFVTARYTDFNALRIAMFLFQECPILGNHCEGMCCVFDLNAVYWTQFCSIWSQLTHVVLCYKVQCS